MLLRVLILVLLATLAGSAGASTLCWIQPGEPPANGWELEIAGVPVAIAPVSRGPDVSPDGIAGTQWCAGTLAHGLYEWDLFAIAADGFRVPSSNGPKIRGCPYDVNRDGGVSLADVAEVMTHVGGCGGG